MDTILTRIESFLQRDGYSANSFATKIGVDPGNMRKMLAGKQNITDKTLRKISESFNIRFEWLKYGEGEMFNAKPEINAKELYPEISYTEGVPYYDEDFLLGFDEILAPSNEHPEYLIRMPGYEKATLWCNASGHSMEPEINNGDIIALQRVKDFSFLPFGDVYGIITTNGMRTIKRLGRSTHEGHYRLIPTNKVYDEQEIPIDKIAIVYRVMGTMKAF